MSWLLVWFECFRHCWDLYTDRFVEFIQIGAKDKKLPVSSSSGIGPDLRSDKDHPDGLNKQEVDSNPNVRYL